jgi:hypothetical protein
MRELTNDALIGHTGFVGGALKAVRDFKGLYNSANIQEIEGRSFDTVFCAGARAEKWIANQNPSGDLAAINRLIASLKMVSVRRLVLLSTVDVFGDQANGSEKTRPSMDGLHAYGMNRLILENFVSSWFESYSIVRLPGLFGNGLKKNAIYDLIHNHQLENVNPIGVLQWYPTRRLSHDLDVVINNDLKLCHLTVQPVLTSDIRDRFFSNANIGPEVHPAPNYDIKTDFAKLWGVDGSYQMSAADMFLELKCFLDKTGGDS